jgi:hypothetical protein
VYGVALALTLDELSAAVAALLALYGFGQPF